MCGIVHVKTLLALSRVVFELHSIVNLVRQGKIFNVETTVTSRC
jgi:hypothetical protein